MTGLTAQERNTLVDLTCGQWLLTDRDVHELRAILLTVDPVTDPADDLLIDAAVSFSIDGDAWPDGQITWMQYACRAADRLHGPLSDNAISTLECYALLLTAQGLTHDALHVRETILLRCATGDHLSYRAAALAYAVAAHADGQCATSVNLLRALMPARLTDRERRTPSGIVPTLIGFLIGCGHDQHARQIAEQYATTIGPPAGPDYAARTTWALVAMIQIDSRNRAHAAVCTNPGPDANTPPEQRLTPCQWRAILEDPAGRLHPG